MSGSFNSLPKSRRLRAANDFSRVLSHGCRADGEIFQVYAKPNGQNNARLGLVVAKKTEGSAVRRNLAKRLVREIFRGQQRAISGLDVVARLRRPMVSGESQKARRELTLLLTGLQRCRG